MSYLNTAPLVHGLLHQPYGREFDLTFEVPSECARAVETGRADLGIVPVAEMARHGWDWIRGTAIAGIGAVRSIFLISRCEPRKIRNVAADAGSRTSVQLARIVLRERHGADPSISAMAPDLDAMLAAADAALIIGDAALRLDPAAIHGHVLDLGEEWWKLTHLPMVFALWAGRPERLDEIGRGRLERVFRQSLDYGLARIAEIAETESPRRGFPAPLIHEYLTRYIRYDTGPAEERGLERFLQYVSELDTLVPAATASLC